MTAPAPLPVPVVKAKPTQSVTPRKSSAFGAIPECGTYQGYGYHKRNGDERCDPCWAASAEYQRSKYKPSTRVLVKCGTPQGRRKHQRDKTSVCVPCQNAPAEPRTKKAVDE